MGPSFSSSAQDSTHFTKWEFHQDSHQDGWTLKLLVNLAKANFALLCLYKLSLATFSESDPNFLILKNGQFMATIGHSKRTRQKSSKTEFGLNLIRPRDFFSLRNSWSHDPPVRVDGNVDWHTTPWDSPKEASTHPNWFSEIAYGTEFNIKSQRI